MTREDPAEEHDLDHVDKLDLIVYHIFDTVLESGQLRRYAPVQALLFLGGEQHGDAGSEFGGRRPVGIAWLGDVEPPDCHPFTVSTKEPTSQVTLGILPTMAPPHSACWPLTIFGLTLKICSHRPKWGLMRRKASHTTINAEMLRTKFGAIMKI